MQQHLGRLDGVAKVEVSLLNGTVAIFPKEDARLDPATIMKATYDSGVTVAEMTLTASGRLKNEPGRGWIFELANRQSFDVTPSALLEKTKSASGDAIRIRGRLYQKTGKKEKVPPETIRLEILEILPPAPGNGPNR